MCLIHFLTQTQLSIVSCIPPPADSVKITTDVSLKEAERNDRPTRRISEIPAKSDFSFFDALVLKMI